MATPPHIWNLPLPSVAALEPRARGEWPPTGRYAVQSSVSLRVSAAVSPFALFFFSFGTNPLFPPFKSERLLR